MNKDDVEQIANLLDEKIAPIQEELTKHGIELTKQGKELTKHGKILRSHDNILRSLKKDQSKMLKMLDGEQMQQSKRLKRLEEHISFTNVNV